MVMKEYRKLSLNNKKEYFENQIYYAACAICLRVCR
jgi:hypothetical protein